MSDLTKNFSRREFSCKCGCGFDDISPDLVADLQALRDALGKPIRVVSGCRCAKRNAAVGGAKSSQHLTGCAADIQVDGMTPYEVKSVVLLHCPRIVAGGIGLYDAFLHADVRRHAARWDDRKVV